jgi:hypothetical protein
MPGDCTVFYQGGSGGFALYYYLMLSGKFHMDIETAWSKIKYQYPSHLANDPTPWKQNEQWPDTVIVKKLSGPRLFIICNPMWSTDMITLNHAIGDGTHKIFLYTSLKLQLRLAWEKSAYWFTDLSRAAFDAPDCEQEYLRWIKRSGIKFNNMIVDPRVPEIIEEFRPDEVLSLEDLLFKRELLSGPATPDQHRFLDYWISIQPKKAQHLMQL